MKNKNQATSPIFGTSDFLSIMVSNAQRYVESIWRSRRADMWIPSSPHVTYRENISLGSDVGALQIYAFPNYWSQNLSNFRSLASQHQLRGWSRHIFFLLTYLIVALLLPWNKSRADRLELQKAFLIYLSMFDRILRICLSPQFDRQPSPSQP